MGQSLVGTAQPPVPTILDHRARILALVRVPEPREETKSTSTRGRVLQAAAGMFAERGFESCTMRDLAAAAGVKAPALYNHFSSKEGILAEAMALALEDFYSSVLGPLESEPPEQWLELIVRRHTLYQLEHVVAAKAQELLMESEALSRHLSEQEYARMRATQREYVRIIRELVVAGTKNQTEEQTTVASYSIVAMCNWVKGWYRHGGNLTPSDVADNVWQLILRMLAQP